MVEHIVLIKFLEEPSETQIQELIQKTLALKVVIPGIMDIRQGSNFSSRNKGYQVGLTVRFEDRASLENYGPHPAHQEIVKFLKEIGLEDTLVVDFECN
ncbi:Dabb family protein [Peribacillus glennii]|uniref:Dabb family protein n=1 Tax=Peribacillus glennii TaxID=2303991 RepID=A0A372LGT3_9BACI|nr:Dabb family protein [Peribacillus glennii]RFU65289.1 Dabb family protein [Peribacillus glennii]